MQHFLNAIRHRRRQLLQHLPHHAQPLRKEIGHPLALRLLLAAPQPLHVRPAVHARRHQQRAEAAVHAQLHVRVAPIANHQRAIRPNRAAVALQQRVAHERLRLADQRALPPSDHLDGGQQWPRLRRQAAADQQLALVAIGADKQAARPLQVRGRLEHLREAEVLVEADYDGADVVGGLEAMVHEVGERGRLPAEVVRSDAAVRDADGVQFGADARAADDVAAAGELALLQVGGGRAGRGDDVALCGRALNYYLALERGCENIRYLQHVMAQRDGLLMLLRPRRRRIIGDKKDPLAKRSQSVQRLR